MPLLLRSVLDKTTLEEGKGDKMHTVNNSAQNSSQSMKPFRGLLTRLLNEAFYLEEEALMLNFDKDDCAFENEDEQDQQQFIKGLLSPLRASI